MIVGSHVSIRNGYLGSAQRAVANEAAAFQYFPKNPRSLSIKDYDQEDAAGCKKFCELHQIHSVAHTPYSTSLTPSEEKAELTIRSLLNDLEIANACGSIGVVVHFGSQISKADPLASYHLMLKMLNAVLSQWNGDCLILLENNAGTKGALGITFEEMIQIRSLCDYPEKIGFCFDTCHAFASGLWDGNNTDALIARGEKQGYWEHLKVVHLNNSKYPTGSKKDRHANIFSNGYIQDEQLGSLITSPLFKNVPLILETPDDEGISHKEEIHKVLETWSS